MNWSKIKNIMIMVLVLINLFLLADIALTEHMGKSIPDDVGKSFESILSKSGITIEKRLLPSRYEERRVVKARLYDIDYLTEVFIGEKVKYVSEGQSIVAPGGDKRLAVTGAMFEYTTLKEGVEKKGKDILKAIKELGFDTKGAYFDKETGYVKIKLDSISVEGIYLDVTLDKNGDIASLRGVWPKLSFEGSDAKVSVISAVNAICEALPSGSHISDIERIYVFSQGADGYQISPAWRIHNQGRGYVVELK